jgi:tetratricopeptide (TPR) repeat protein
MAQAAFDAGDFVKCLEIIAAEPADLAGHDRLVANCCIRLGRLDEAIDKLDAMIAKNPNDGTLTLERKGIAGQLNLLRAEAANELFKSGELEAAMAAYTSINLEDCSDVAKFSICNNRGALYLQGGEAVLALGDFESALLVKPMSIDALHNRASALKVIGRGAEALAGFEKCLEQDPDFYLGLCGKTECLSMLARYEEAVACATVAIDLSPDQSRAYVNRGFAKLKSGDVAAVSDFEAAVAQGDDSDETDRLLAIALSVEGDRHLSAGRDQDAVGSYEKALGHGSQGTPNLNVLFNYALAQLHLGQRSEALEGLKYVASLASPEKLLFEASWAAGLICLQDSDPVTAVGYLETAAELKPQHVDAQYNLGVARLQAGNDSAGALECFNKALALDPTHISAKQAADMVGGLDSSKANLIAAAREKAMAGAATPAEPEPEPEPVSEPVAEPDPDPVPEPAVPEPVVEALPPVPVELPLIGKNIVVNGLVNKAEMNGVMGKVTGFDSSTGRYTVQVIVNGVETVAKLKETNMTETSAEMAPVAKPAAPKMTRPSLAQSMADMSVVEDTSAETAPRKSRKQVRASFVTVMTYSLEDLQSGKVFEGVDPTRKETYLSDDAFETAFQMTREEFMALPNWKKMNKRKELKIF